MPRLMFSILMCQAQPVQRAIVCMHAKILQYQEEYDIDLPAKTIQVAEKSTEYSARSVMWPAVITAAITSAAPTVPPMIVRLLSDPLLLELVMARLWASAVVIVRQSILLYSYSFMYSRLDGWK